MTDNDENMLLRDQSDRLKENRRENPTLRDKFAMAALTGLCAHRGPNLEGLTYAEYSYEIADEMMRARERLSDDQDS